MAVPAIALYASPPSTVCSSPYQTTNPHDVDFNSRSASSSATSSSPASQKPFLGGLSCLFSTKHAAAAAASSTTASAPGGGEELLGCRRHEKGGEVELGSSCSYSHYSPFSSSLRRDQSPVSVFQGPVSCGRSNYLCPYYFTEYSTVFVVDFVNIFESSLVILDGQIFMYSKELRIEKVLSRSVLVN